MAYSQQFKAQVLRRAEEEPRADVARKFGIHSTTIGVWQKEAETPSQPKPWKKRARPAPVVKEPEPEPEPEEPQPVPFLRLDMEDAERVFTVRAHLARAWEPGKISRKFSKEWGISAEKMLAIIRKARTELASEGASRMTLNFEELYQEHRDRLATIFTALMNFKTIGALNGAARVAKLLAELDGFYALATTTVISERLVIAINPEASQHDPEYMRQVNEVLMARARKQLRSEGWAPPDGQVIDVTPKGENDDTPSKLEA